MVKPMLRCDVRSRSCRRQLLADPIYKTVKDSLNRRAKRSRRPPRRVGKTEPLTRKGPHMFDSIVKLQRAAETWNLRLIYEESPWLGICRKPRTACQGSLSPCKDVVAIPAAEPTSE